MSTGRARPTIIDRRLRPPRLHRPLRLRPPRPRLRPPLRPLLRLLRLLRLPRPSSSSSSASSASFISTASSSSSSSSPSRPAGSSSSSSVAGTISPSMTGAMSPPARLRPSPGISQPPALAHGKCHATSVRSTTRPASDGATRRRPIHACVVPSVPIVTARRAGQRLSWAAPRQSPSRTSSGGSHLRESGACRPSVGCRDECCRMQPLLPCGMPHAPQKRDRGPPSRAGTCVAAGPPSRGAVARPSGHGRMYILIIDAAAMRSRRAVS